MTSALRGKRFEPANSAKAVHPRLDVRGRHASDHGDTDFPFSPCSGPRPLWEHRRVLCGDLCATQCAHVKESLTSCDRPRSRR